VLPSLPSVGRCVLNCSTGVSLADPLMEMRLSRLPFASSMPVMALSGHRQGIFPLPSKAVLIGRLVGFTAVSADPPRKVRSSQQRKPQLAASDHRSGRHDYYRVGACRSDPTAPHRLAVGSILSVVTGVRGRESHRQRTFGDRHNRTVTGSKGSPEWVRRTLAGPENDGPTHRRRDTVLSTPTPPPSLAPERCLRRWLPPWRA
jgi:hypothetical protein